MSTINLVTFKAEKEIVSTMAGGGGLSWEDFYLIEILQILDEFKIH